MVKKFIRNTVAGLAMMLGTVLPSFGQNYDLTGRVRALERNTGTPLQEVRVDVDSSKYLAFTNSDGTFTINDIPAGTHNIRISKDGYIGVFKKDYTLDSDKILNVSLADTIQESPAGTQVLKLDEYRELPPFDQYRGLQMVYDPKPNGSTWNSVTEGNFIPIYLASANSADSLAFRNAIGECNGDWTQSPAGSVEREEKRAIYILSNDPDIGMTKRGIFVQFHAGITNTIAGSDEIINNYTYIRTMKVNLAVNLTRIIKKEIQGRCQNKNGIGTRPSYMNSNPVEMTDLDHMHNIVFYNQWAAMARGEQNTNILDMENTPAFGTPTATNITNPTNNATDLEKNVRIQYENKFGTDKYRLQISTAEDFSTILKDLDVLRNDTTLALDPHTTYYARVQTINSEGNSTWSPSIQFATQLPTEINDIGFDDLKVYPTPATDFLNIVYGANFNGTRRIISLNGKVLDSKDISGLIFECVDMTAFPKGTYILNFISGNLTKTIITVKVE